MTGSNKKVWLGWSSGKDSAWALHVLRQQDEFEVVALLTTVNLTYKRVAMHAVRESLLEMQAGAAGLPLVKVSIPSPCPNETYEWAMEKAMTRARAEGVWHVAFGDLFLEDIRAYREKQLAGCGMTPVFPVWGIDTRQLAEEMLAGGLSARLTCVDPRKLDRSFAGRRFDAKLLADLPAGVDPCAGEWRVSQLCERGSDVPRKDSGERGRDCGAGWVCVRGFVAGGASCKRDAIVSKAAS